MSQETDLIESAVDLVVNVWAYLYSTKTQDSIRVGGVHGLEKLGSREGESTLGADSVRASFAANSTQLTNEPVQKFKAALRQQIIAGGVKEISMGDQADRTLSSVGTEIGVRISPLVLPAVSTVYNDVSQYVDIFFGDRRKRVYLDPVNYPPVNCYLVYRHETDGRFDAVELPEWFSGNTNLLNILAERLGLREGFAPDFISVVVASKERALEISYARENQGLGGGCIPPRTYFHKNCQGEGDKVLWQMERAP